jgi:hypothetical protein
LVGVLAFYRGPGERQGGVVGEFNAGINGFNTIEDGGGFKRGFKGGEIKAMLTLAVKPQWVRYKLDETNE